MDERVTELEAQLKKAKALRALELHALALDSARALDHHVPFINEFFKERAQLGPDSVITHNAWDRAICNTLQGGNRDETRGFTITIKESHICIVMVVGKKHGGWAPYKSELYFEDCMNPKRRSLINAGSKKLEIPFYDIYREALRHETLTPLMLNQWISALESFIFEYLRVTGHFYTNTFSNLFHLALIDI